MIFHENHDIIDIVEELSGTVIARKGDDRVGDIHIRSPSHDSLMNVCNPILHLISPQNYATSNLAGFQHC